MSNLRDFEDAVIANPGNYLPGYYLANLLNAVIVYRHDNRCTTAQAIEGICEGHELSREQEADLREHFRVPA